MWLCSGAHTYRYCNSRVCGRVEDGFATISPVAAILIIFRTIFFSVGMQEEVNRRAINKMVRNIESSNASGGK